MENTMSLKFELEDLDGKHTSEFLLDDMESWHNLVIKFTDFLSVRYGYAMSDKVVFVTDHPFGRIKDQHITPHEVDLIQRNRERNADLDSLWGDDE